MLMVVSNLKSVIFCGGYELLCVVKNLEIVLDVR
jgi:hypothetical protein